MSEIVLAIGTSHSPLLNSPPEDYPKHAAIDASGRKLLDQDGNPCTYGELLAKADPSIRRQIQPDVQAERSARCTANIVRLAREIEDAGLDALIVVGDDQHEQYSDDNMPAILVTGVKRSRTIRSAWTRMRPHSGARRVRNFTSPRQVATILSTRNLRFTSSSS